LSNVKLKPLKPSLVSSGFERNMPPAPTTERDRAVVIFERDGRVGFDCQKHQIRNRLSAFRENIFVCSSLLNPPMIAA